MVISRLRSIPAAVWAKSKVLFLPRVGHHCASRSRAYTARDGHVTLFISLATPILVPRPHKNATPPSSLGALVGFVSECAVLTLTCARLSN